MNLHEIYSFFWKPFIVMSIREGRENSTVKMLWDATRLQADRIIHPFQKIFENNENNNLQNRKFQLF